jgi:signal transduction histidine kinase/ligand-binding sensor domain-containing protein
MAATFSASIYAVIPQKLISQFTHTSWFAKDGLPGPIRAIAQTPDGYLWLATQAGLYRYDGIRFAPWEAVSGERLQHSTVSSLYVANDGALWMGFGSGGVSQLHGRRLTNYLPGAGLASGGILAIAQTRDGSIWAGGQYGLSKFEQGRWTQIGNEIDYPAPGAQAILTDKDGCLWIVTDGAKLEVSQDPVRVNTIVRLASDSQRFTRTGLGVGMVRNIVQGPDGSVWIADTTANCITAITHSAGILSSIKTKEEPYCINFDSDGSAWIGLNGGVSRVKNPSAEVPRLLDELPMRSAFFTEVVYAILKDREGSIWIGTSGGLHRFRENKVTPISIGEGLIDQQICIGSTADSSVWVMGYTRDVVQQIKDGKIKTLTLPRYSPSDTTRILSSYAGQSELWVGGSFGLAKEVNGKFSFVPVPVPLADASVHAIGKDAAGNLWIAIWNQDETGRMFCARNGQWAEVDLGNVLRHFRCRILSSDQRGGMWMGFENGNVAVYEGGNLQVYSADNGLPAAKVLAISCDRTGQLWVGSEGGLSQFRDGRFRNLTKENGLPGNSISAILQDAEGSFWLAGSLAVLRVSSKELEKALASPSYRMQGITFDTSDGMRGLPRQREPFPTAIVSAGGELWFTTTEGLAVIDPAHLAKNTVAPPVTIEDVKADDRLYPSTSGLRLRPNTKYLEIQYTALSLAAPERVQFRYKLEGYDRDWLGPVNTRQIRYTNLPPGAYRFRVIASNNDGVWNETGASWDFSLAPAFYQTIWFRVASLAAVAGFFVVLHKLRLRRITGHNTALRREITERERAETLLAEEKRLLHASEQVARGQVEALVQSLDILATAPPPEKFINKMLSTIERFLNAKTVGLWLLDEATDSITLRAAAEGVNLAADHPFVKDGLSWKDNPGLQEMFFTGVPFACEDIETDPGISTAVRNHCRARGAKKFLLIPTLVGGNVKGYIAIGHADRPIYRAEEIELAQALAHQAMFAIELNEFAKKSEQAAVLEERNRMARDIHDTLAQALTGVIIQLQAAEDATSKGYKKDAGNHLQNARELARQGLSEARRSVRALRPQALEDATFWEALQTLIKNATVGTELHAEFQLRGKVRELPAKTQENFLHIGQEALTNTLKYAHAKHFETRLSFNAKEVRLELQDDGNGFKMNGRHDGFGLTGMRERVEQMSGSLTIASAHGKGTKIVVVLSNG